MRSLSCLCCRRSFLFLSLPLSLVHLLVIMTSTSHQYYSLFDSIVKPPDLEQQRNNLTSCLL
ncbi:uncharacterized protein BDV14DRAFT_183062 [Aspergillus stella-maris]|uniref:uncharacterized protein n=1 Tax=Aspergillus stella-maris TaxID=1810926 RepID=UPI003CCE0CD8